MLSKQMYADGGEVGGSADDDKLLDHCAVELMHAIQNKDVKAFRESLRVLICDVVNEMDQSEDEES
jgi:hypothetical protein